MFELSLGEIARICNAALPDGCDPSLRVRSVCTDTRIQQPDALFVPLKAARDGHEFIRQAELGGAVATLAEREVEAGIPVIVVPDCLHAMGQIACNYRESIPVKVIGITGSVGKTTCKEMLAAILSLGFRVCKTQENFNNEIGVPRTIFSIKRDDEIAVLEMGMNHFGELSRLTAVARPDVAVINNIGTMHIEFLGSREGICRAKLEILEGLKDGGVAVLNADEPLLWEKRDEIGHKIIWFGIENPESDVFTEDIHEDVGNVSFSVRGVEQRFELPVAGLHNVSNALAAIAAAGALGADARTCAEGLRSFVPVRQRSFVRDGFFIIDDAYNAGPESMAAALGLLGRRPGRRIAVLGDMLELGDRAAEEHFKVGRLAAEKAQLLLCLGELSAECCRGALEAGMPESAVHQFTEIDALVVGLREIVREGDSILFKASHSIGMERALEKFFGEDGG